MNIDSNPMPTTDTTNPPIHKPVNTRLMHNSNDMNTLHTEDNHSKPSNKYYNHYYTNHNHGHPHAHHSHSHSNPLSSHTKSQHNQRHHRSINNHNAHHSQHNGHSNPLSSAPPSTSSPSYHSQPSFVYKSHHNHHKHKNTHKRVHPRAQSTQHHHHGHSESYANQNVHKLARRVHEADALSDSEIMDLDHHHNQRKDDKELTNGNRKQIQSTNTTTVDKQQHALHTKDDTNHEAMDSSPSASDEHSSSDETPPAYPVKAIAFDLDKTMVRTISLHTNEQPQPEQHPNSYFMFFDEDTKEYHHVYKRPYLTQLLDFLSSEIVVKNRCKMMLCTHGTQKYAQTILEKCKADQLFRLCCHVRIGVR
eukprot:502349_1